MIVNGFTDMFGTTHRSPLGYGFKLLSNQDSEFWIFVQVRVRIRRERRRRRRR